MIETVTSWTASVSEAQDFGSPAGRAPPWSGVTLLDLFASAVQLNGAVTAYAEIGSLGVPGRSRTYAEAHDAVERIRTRLEDLDLPRGAVALLCTGASIDAPLVLLAMLAAGLTPCLVPPVATDEDLVKLCRASGAQVLVTCSQIGDVRPAEQLRRAAVEAGLPRYMMGFGERLPAGVMSLDGGLSEVREVSQRTVLPGARSAAASILTVELSPDGASLYVHDQEALVALALEWVLRSGVGTGETVTTTLSPMTQAGLVIALAPLLTGGSLLLQPLFSGPALLAALRQGPRMHLAGPAALQDGLRKAGLLGGPELGSTTLLHRPPLRFDGLPVVQARESAIIDMLSLGERTLLLARRGADGRPALSLAEARIPDDDGGLVLACRQDGALRISVSGASVATRLNERKPDRDTDWLATPFIASLDRDGQIATIIRVNSPLSAYPAAVT